MGEVVGVAHWWRLKLVWAWCREASRLIRFNSAPIVHDPGNKSACRTSFARQARTCRARLVRQAAYRTNFVWQAACHTKLQFFFNVKLVRQALVTRNFCDRCLLHQETVSVQLTLGSTGCLSHKFSARSACRTNIKSHWNSLVARNQVDYISLW